MYLTLLQVYGGVYPADKHWYRCRVKELVGDDQVLLSRLICYNISLLTCRQTFSLTETLSVVEKNILLGYIEKVHVRRRLNHF